MQGLSSTGPLRHLPESMIEKPQKPTREQRLAAKLRENLRRRKAQARALGAPDAGSDNGDENAALSKKPPKG